MRESHPLVGTSLPPAPNVFRGEVRSKCGSTIVEPTPLTEINEAFDKHWSVIVWNDPINLMDYVVYVFQKVLHMTETQARKHMLEVHHQGKSLVAQETHERAEHLVHELQAFGLQATLQSL